MAWENALDRLLLQQIHLAEKGEARNRDIEGQLAALAELNPARPQSWFHHGYARALLGLESSDPSSSDDRRWYLFGRLRGHDRRGERNWVAEMLQQGSLLMDLLQDSQIAAQCLPLVMRTLFWCEDLALAVRALEFLSTGTDSDNSEMLVDAALTDLLSRLEVRQDREDAEPTGSILETCIELQAFERLPQDVRARYFRALAARMLAGSEFEEAQQKLQLARTLAVGSPRLQSSIDAMLALAQLHVHDVSELQPQGDRPERTTALEALASAAPADSDSVPDALFIRGILNYEQGEYEASKDCFDRALTTLRRTSGRDLPLIYRTRFFVAASILSAGDTDETSRALRLMEQALEHVHPDLESFYAVHEALKTHDRKIALRFLDAVDIGRGTAADQLLFIALEYLGLAEAEPASVAAKRVLQVAVDLDQRVEAMRVLLTAHNMQGDRDGARQIYFDMRDLLIQRGAFSELENLLKNEEAVGQALDHIETKCELVALYEEMDGRDYDKANLQLSIARSMRARKDVDSLHEAFGVLKEVEIQFPDMARDDLDAIEKLLALSDAAPANLEGAAHTVASLTSQLGRAPRVLVVGGNERQRRHHPRFDKLAEEWKFDGEWLMANYTSPQKLVSAIVERLRADVDLLLLLHWNRHETTEPALDAARKMGVPARTLHYAGFTSLQVGLTDMLAKIESSATAGK